MPEHPNATLVRELFAAFEDNDLATADARLADDVIWHFPGRRGRIAGDHEGKAAILGFLANIVALTGGSFHLEISDVLASDRGAAVLFRGHAERESRRLDNPTCLVMTIIGDRVVELWEYVWDLEHVEAFWS